MSNKLLIILIIVILFLSGFYAYNELSNSTIKIGDTTFNIPEGYHESTPNHLGAVNITNGNTSIFLSVYNDTNILKHANDYKKLLEKDNQTAIISNYTIGGAQIYKSTIIDLPNCVHYWFIKNNKTYDFYTWDGNKDVERIIIEFINS